MAQLRGFGRLQGLQSREVAEGAGPRRKGPESPLGIAIGADQMH